MYLEHIDTIPFSCFPEGPNAEVFEIHLVADNKTITQVDMGELGGVRPATAEFKDDSLITYLYNDKVIDILATRTIIPTSKFVFSRFFVHVCNAHSVVVTIDDGIVNFS